MFPPITPFASGHLTRPDGAAIYWETSGNPRGRPALYLHGGPGGGLGKGGYRRRFDPERYLIVGLDQRGCGQSIPLAIDDLDGLDLNTTDALIADIEALREHLAITSWLMHGVSWGTTLALAYALDHPTRVTELVLAAVTTTSPEEVDWITHGVGRLFPEAWAAFEAASTATKGEPVVAAYARLLLSPDPSVRAVAALAWDTWEGTHISLDPHASPGLLFDDARTREVFATLVTHYWANAGFLHDQREILPRAAQLASIAGVLIHGRHDVSGPAVTAWLLHKAWPGSRLHIVETEGHGGPDMMELVTLATGEFASPGARATLPPD